MSRSFDECISELTEADVLARVATEANTGCWLWERGAQNHGYGCWPMAGGHKLAHRVSYQVANGLIPDGMMVCHRCDTPACINPAHLFLGNQAANMADCAAKGRIRTPSRSGAAHHAAKLSEVDVRTIRLDERGHAEVARDYGVTRQAIFQLRKGTSWQSL